MKTVHTTQGYQKNKINGNKQNEKKRKMRGRHIAGKIQRKCGTELNNSFLAGALVVK